MPNGICARIVDAIRDENSMISSYNRLTEYLKREDNLDKRSEDTINNIIRVQNGNIRLLEEIAIRKKCPTLEEKRLELEKVMQKRTTLPKREEIEKLPLKERIRLAREFIK